VPMQAARRNAIDIARRSVNCLSLDCEVDNDWERGMKSFLAVYTVGHAKHRQPAGMLGIS